MLAGRGATLEDCRALAETLGVAARVVFAGFVPDVQVCYHAADVCVSTSRSEGLPFNLMEAMHCALPIVVTDVKGHEDLAQEGKAGILVPYGDEEQLCAALTELMSNPALIMQLGCEGEKMVERYRLEYVIEANMKFINDAVVRFRDME